MRGFPIWPGLRWVRAGLRSAAQIGLHECAACGSDMMFAVERREVDAERSTFRLRCGACGAARDAHASRAQAADFDGVVASQRRAIAHELSRLERAHMAEELDRLAEALRRDLIDAADFEPRRTTDVR